MIRTWDFLVQPAILLRTVAGNGIHEAPLEGERQSAITAELVFPVTKKEAGWSSLVPAKELSFVDQAIGN